MTNREKGFTLVELLVVITIIAILATIGMTVYKGAEKQGRMSKRIGDLKAIQSALELYYSINKSYPVVTLGTQTGWRGECSNHGSKASFDVVPSTSKFVPDYMVAFPSDPTFTPTSTVVTDNNKGCYAYNSDGYDYKVLILNVDEIGTTDLQANFNYWDPYHGSPHPLPCTATAANRKLAIYSSTTSRCW